MQNTFLFYIDETFDQKTEYKIQNRATNLTTYAIYNIIFFIFRNEKYFSKKNA